jgi:hypothetical protein
MGRQGSGAGIPTTMTGPTPSNPPPIVPAALSLVLSAEIGSVMTALRQNTKWGAPAGRYNVRGTRGL